jgi:hypothetical protein
MNGRGEEASPQALSPGRLHHGLATGPGTGPGEPRCLCKSGRSPGASAALFWMDSRRSIITAGRAFPCGRTPPADLRTLIFRFSRWKTLMAFPAGETLRRSRGGAPPAQQARRPCLPDEENGALRFAHHALGHAADQALQDARPAVGSDDDEIGLPFLLLLEDRLVGRP